MLSVQQLIDCNVANHGCGGGNVLDAFTYIISNEGLNTEQNYPYHGIQRTCDTVKEKGDGLEIDAYTIVNPRNKDQLAYALCEQPVVVGINAHGSNFSQYRGGIYRSECGTDISHSDDTDEDDKKGEGSTEEGADSTVEGSTRDEALTNSTKGICTPFFGRIPSSFKHTIIVREKLAPGEVVIKVGPDDHKQVQTFLDEGDSADSISWKAKMTEFLKGATAVGVVSANGELLINSEAFIKSLVDHGCFKTMETAMNKLKFEDCCNFKHVHGQ
ncbi:hypothetical protein ACE6H2_016603 [Prunus campanulata]